MMNNWIFRGKLISSPRSALFRMIFFIQQWGVISSGEDQSALEQLIEAIMLQVPEEVAAVGVG
jgi:hypothetical protein